MEAEGPFTQAQVEDQVASSKTYYTRRDKEVRVDVELYNMDFTLDLPDGFHEIKSPTTKTLCDRSADRIGGGRWQSHIDPRNGSDTELRRIEKKEKTASSLPYLMRRRVKYNPIRGMALHAFNRGAFVPKVQLDINFEMTKPKKEDFGTTVAYNAATKLWAYRAVNNFPLILDVRPIENIYPDTETDGDNYIIERYQRRVGDIRKNFPNWGGWQTILEERLKDKKTKSTEKKNIQNYPDEQRVIYTEVWTRTHRAVMVDGQFVGIGQAEPGPVPNLYGRPPYFVRFSGFGDPSGEPHQVCVSILRAIRYTSRSMSRLYSIIDTVAENEAYGATLLKKGDSGNAAFEIGPAAKNEMDFPELVRPYQTQGINQSLLAALGMITQVNETGSVSSDAIGQPPPGGRGPFPQSGVGAAISTGQASMILDPVNQAIQDAMSDVASFCFYILDDVQPMELPVWGQVGDSSYVQFTLKSDDIDGHYGPIYMKNLMRSPEDDYAKYQLGIQAMSSGMPPEFVMEKFFGIENSHEMVKDMMAKQIAYSPKVRDEYLIPRLIERLRAKAENRAENVPGDQVAAPSGQPPVALPPAAPPNMGTPVAPQPPNDAMTAAQAGISQVGPAVANGPAVSTAGV